jgi:hypothetical protein
MKKANLAFLCLCFTSVTIAFAFGEFGKSDCYKYKRLSDYFIIGEKSVQQPTDRTTKKTWKRGITTIPNFGEINAFSIIDVKLDTNPDIIPALRRKTYNILLVAELKKKGEDSWHRISVVNRYSREIQKSSHARQYTKARKSTKATQTKEQARQYTETEKSAKDTTLRPYYVADVILSDNPFIRQGDRVQTLFFYDVTDSLIFEKDLENAQCQSKSLMSIDAQEMYLMQVGSAPKEYAAKQGDKIRLRFLRAEYGIPQLHDIEKKKAKDTPQKDIQQKNIQKYYKKEYADFVSVEDEMNFTFREFGIKLIVLPTIAYGSQFGENFDAGEFNPIDKNLSLGSNIYIGYDGRNEIKKEINLLPGLHFSLLGLNATSEVKFTGGIVWSLPSLREWIGIFVGLYDLKHWVFGLTFSPDIRFSKLVQAEKQQE